MSNVHGSKWIRPEKRLAIYARDGFACLYCGETADEGAQLSLDHVQPRELGGTHHETNLVACCIGCNSARSGMSLRAWFATLRDRGIDTTKLAAKIRRQTTKKLDTAVGKALLAARKGG